MDRTETDYVEFVKNPIVNVFFTRVHFELEKLGNPFPGTCEDFLQHMELIGYSRLSNILHDIVPAGYKKTRVDRMFRMIKEWQADGRFTQMDASEALGRGTMLLIQEMILKAAQ